MGGLTWRGLWRRFVRLLLPPPTLCPKCEEPCHEYLLDTYTGHGVIIDWVEYRCSDCGHSWEAKTVT